jgi:hypothetical protein
MTEGGASSESERWRVGNAVSSLKGYATVRLWLGEEGSFGAIPLHGCPDWQGSQHPQCRVTLCR